MGYHHPQFVEIGNPTRGGLKFLRDAAHAAGMSDLPYQYADIGLRLATIRQGFSDHSQKAWAEKHGFNSTQWNNWESGFRRIPLEAAERLCETYGLTLDFVYRGRRDGLSENALKVL